LRVRAEPVSEASRVLQTLPDVESLTRVNGVLEVGAALDRAAAINRALVEAGVDVSELYADRASLEHVFLELTGGER
ncbi:MAG TPA: hypothetical protein VFX51_26035, partial [Solirubrobacteraceae bacterium]|nr:hypothetical protein [Solirubrobacteraceae bacterium]